MILTWMRHGFCDYAQNDGKPGRHRRRPFDRPGRTGSDALPRAKPVAEQNSVFHLPRLSSAKTPKQPASNLVDLAGRANRTLARRSPAHGGAVELPARSTEQATGINKAALPGRRRVQGGRAGTASLPVARGRNPAFPRRRRNSHAVANDRAAVPAT